MYSIRERRARDLIELTTPTFLDYFDRRVIPLLKLNMDTKEKTGLPKTVAPWTNNNCESANHILKQAVQWKGQCLVQLIDTLHSIVKGQYKDLKRAIINGLGNFHIIPPLQKRLCMDASVWERKNARTTKDALWAVTHNTSVDSWQCCCAIRWPRSLTLCPWWWQKEKPNQEENQCTHYHCEQKTKTLTLCETLI